MKGFKYTVTLFMWLLNKFKLFFVNYGRIKVLIQAVKSQQLYQKISLNIRIKSFQLDRKCS